MDAYTSFAQVYDMFMDNVPYEQWGTYIHNILKEYGIDSGILLDLGCGTGKMTEFFADKGYDMIGVDNSSEMLEIAMENNSRGILYLLQDMREFELYGTVRAIYSACDCINYILDEDDLLRVFKLVNNYLDPGGIFIFDINSEYKYREILGENTFAENRPESSFIWDNFFHCDQNINEYDLTLFIRDEDDKYLRYTETHYQRSYSIHTIEELIAEAGMELLAVYDGYTEEAVKEDSERITIIAREKGKNIK